MKFNWFVDWTHNGGHRVLLLLYAKAKTDNITGAKLKEIRHALES